MKKQTGPSDTEMLDWVGECVSAIHSVDAPSKRVEIECYPHDNGDDLEIVARSGKTEVEAFRKCVRHAMEKWPVTKEDGGMTHEPRSYTRHD